MRPFKLLVHPPQHLPRKIMMLAGDFVEGFLVFVVPFSIFDLLVDMGTHIVPESGGEWQLSH